MEKKTKIALIVVSIFGLTYIFNACGAAGFDAANISGEFSLASSSGFDFTKLDIERQCISQDVELASEPTYRLNQTELQNSLVYILGLNATEAKVLKNAYVSKISDSSSFRGYSHQNMLKGLNTNFSFEVIKLATHAAEKLYTKKFLKSSCSTKNRACFSKFLQQYLEIIFRTPVTAENENTYLALYNTVYQVSISKNLGWTRSFKEAFTASFASIFMSPQFHIKWIPPSNVVKRKLTAYELATRLSFTLARTTPTTQLLALAKSGKILNKSILKSEAEKMLLANSAKFSEEFIGQWLYIKHYKGSSEIAKPNTGIQFNDLYNEAYLVFKNLLENEGSIQDLYEPGFTYATKDLAKEYKLNHTSASRYQRIPSSKHGGILAQMQFFKSTAVGPVTKPITRGVRVLGSLLCDPIGAAEAVFEVPEEEVEFVIDSPRDFVELHSSSPVCYSCHKKIDPIGLGLENLDAFGNWRTVYKDGNYDGAVNSQSRLFGVSYNTSDELISLLKRSDHVYECIKKKLLTSLTSQTYFENLSCTLNQVDGGQLKKEMGIKETILNIIASDAFTTIKR